MSFAHETSPRAFAAPPLPLQRGFAPLATTGLTPWIEPPLTFAPIPLEIRSASSRDTLGKRLADRFDLDTALTVATTTLKKAQLTITRIASGRGIALASPLPPERAYLIHLQLRDTLAEVGRMGQREAAAPLPAGSIVITDLEDEPSVDLRQSFDSLLIHVPRLAFEELAEDHGAPRISDLVGQHGTVDPVAHHLGRALLPSLDDPHSAPPRFFDHVAFALHARLAAQYGRLGHEPARRPGALTVWQERVAKAALIADLGEEPSIAAAAAACGLPPGRFARAFRESVGMPPYRWLRGFRVERAKELLLSSKLALAQIAYECGFADQSHFTRVFASVVGTTPGAWRRARCG